MLSSPAISPALYGAVSTLQYSILESMRDLKSVIIGVVSRVRNVRKIHPASFLAEVAFELLCSPKVRASDIMTPRSFTWAFRGMTWFDSVLYEVIYYFFIISISD